jgi:hypothetical protein
VIITAFFDTDFGATTFPPGSQGDFEQRHGDKAKISLRMFFINTSKDVIFHQYDDRGLDVVANSVSALRGLYETFYTWILDYDIQRIDAILGNRINMGFRNNLLTQF